ncbi:DUF6266 family protein [Parapedobacter deserti]|uniref:DUF6266 family protein n=1 Tax=Parapedobacter deserti TaxID=1912957 RepID=A0ABV7JJ67_9SPHI
MEFFYDRSKPKPKEKSYGKLAVQQRMRLAMAFLNPLRPVIAESWLLQGKGSKKKAFGQALKRLMEEAMEGEYPEQHVVPERVTISTGMLPALQVADVVHTPQELEVYFTSSDNPMAGASDEVVLVVYSPEAGVAGRNTHTCKRSDGSIKVELPPPLWSSPFLAYLFVHSATKKQYSRSTYIGHLSTS